ncbi:aminoacyl tRNA synthase complex-interacting multifunctional protein 1 [Clupea harengus]|uniref:Aminoacyl tRNA synthase complex-interacting multifunctional protein 1 n=1 Tax=Clupea harengus TaxID=7950 RepID=A0A6P8GPU9_CLUHA|nr:aminoacyl tRNA synthase complex-interacting multifunctional protein 1 [Clupea harengus]XP_031441229.1 aminoacyl tRNA synthase complex-interacting multifunctional protein 1 [Clupea harengus]
MSAPGLPSRNAKELKEQEQMMEFLKQKMMLFGEKAMLQKSVREEKKLLVENAKLKDEIEQLKKQLQENQRRKAAKQKALAEAQAASPATPEPTGGATLTPSATPSKAAPRKPKPQGESEGRKKKGTCRKSGVQGSELGIRQLELRVGRILSARQHPEAESLCVQEVDLGEGQPRTAVSRILTNTPTEQMSESLCVCVCNGRAVRVRGVLSKVHVLCATDSAHLEMLTPPSSAQPGDRVTFNNYPGEPDRELSPRVFGRLQPDLCTDPRGVACYQGVAFEVKGKGLCRAPSICNGSIK